MSQHTRPRILHIVYTLGSGGVEMNLAVVIGETIGSFDHHVLCVRASGIVGRRLEALGVPITVLGKRTGKDWSLAWRIARHCRKVNPHVVHTRNWATFDGIIGARLARVPAVIHGVHGFDIPVTTWRMRWSLWALSPLIDRVLAVSEELRHQLSTDFGVPAHKIAVARNGVDSARFHPHHDGAAMRRKEGYADTDFVIGVAARLDSIKNHVGLVNAFARVAERRPDAHLLLVGDGPERGRIEDEIARLGLTARVRLVGYQAEVESWMSIFDLFAYSPLFEGMPNGVLEAMAAGLPVVATRVGGMPEAVIDGVTGRLVAPGDADALAAAIDFYRNDSQARASHGAAGRARVMTDFTRQSMIAAYTENYQAVIAGLAVTDRIRPRG